MYYDVFMGCGIDAETPLAVSPAAVAKRYGVPRKTVNAFIQSGELQTIQLNGRTKILESDLEIFFQRRIEALGIIPPYDSDGDEGKQDTSIM